MSYATLREFQTGALTRFGDARRPGRAGGGADTGPVGACPARRSPLACAGEYDGGLRTLLLCRWIETGVPIAHAAEAMSISRSATPNGAPLRGAGRGRLARPLEPTAALTDAHTARHPGQRFCGRAPEQDGRGLHRRPRGPAGVHRLRGAVPPRLAPPPPPRPPDSGPVRTLRAQPARRAGAGGCEEAGPVPAGGDHVRGRPAARGKRKVGYAYCAPPSTTSAAWPTPRS